MVRRRISETQRWQIIGMHTTGMSFKALGRQMGYHYTVVSRLVRAWRHKNTAYTPRNIQPTVPYGGGSVMVWGCISHDCKLDLVTIQCNLTGDQYIRDVLQPVVVPHFDNHPLATRPVYMDDNARPHRSRTVTPTSKVES